jgi:hypothetical protein
MGRASAYLNLSKPTKDDDDNDRQPRKRMRLGQYEIGHSIRPRAQSSFSSSISIDDDGDNNNNDDGFVPASGFDDERQPSGFNLSEESQTTPQVFYLHSPSSYTSSWHLGSEFQ